MLVGCFRSVARQYRHLLQRLPKMSTLACSDSDVGQESGCVIAACQMTSTADKEKNLSTGRHLISRAASLSAKVVFLPEAFDFIGESVADGLSLAEKIDGPLISEYQQLAKQHGVWLSLGGMHERGPPEDSKRVFNTHVLINNVGTVVRSYRKAHLFECEIPNQVSLHESRWAIPGRELVPPIPSPAGKIAMAICYDMRFPEMSLALAKQGADILTFPSAFTVPTGMAHWEVLLRARAIETQCYVVAAAQTGKHNSKRQSYGHTMIIDPWGCVVAACHEGTDVCVARVDHFYQKKIRQEMPIFEHRRHDLYTGVQACFETRPE